MNTKAQREIVVVVTVDVDSDKYYGNLVPKDFFIDKTIRGWEGFEKGKDLFIEEIEKVKEVCKQEVPITWFVRCDQQIRAQFGNWSYLLEHYNRWWLKRLAQGDDIQWHAHLYTLKGSRWVQETDEGRLNKDLLLSKIAFEKSGFQPCVIRIGEAYHSNELMRCISALGLKADSTAIPGRKRQDEEKCIDWEVTQNKCYHPSLGDYRQEGMPSYELWEIPMNTVETRISYDAQPLKRYANLAFQPGVLDGGLQEFFAQHDVLVTITHPFELIPVFFRDDQKNGHPLLAFDSEAVFKNCKSLISMAESAKKKIRFITMKQLVGLLEEK